MIYTIELFCKLVSKKNLLVERVSKSGKRHRSYGAATEDLKEIESQIDPELRGLMLQHPEVTVQFTTPHDHVDRDGLLTTVLDALKKQSVIEDDSIKHFNGKITVLPAILSDHWRCIVTLRTKRRTIR